jgi:hypothetical protein
MGHADIYMQQTLDALMTPWGWAAIAVLILMAIGTVMFPRTRWVLLSLMLWVSSFGILNTDTELQESQRLIAPLRFFQLYAREVTLGLLLLFIPSILAGRGWRSRLIVGAAAVFLVFEMWISARLWIGGMTSAVRPIVNASTAALLMIALCAGAGRWLQSSESAFAMLKAFAGCAVLFAGANILQMAVHPSSIVTGRISGTTGNPQAVAQECMLLLPSVLVLITERRVAVRWRTLMIATAAALVLLTLWSGSRLGMVLAIVGVIMLLRRRLGRGLLITLLVGALVCLGIEFIPETASNLSRFVDTTNTRSDSWAFLIETFSHNMLIGAPSAGDSYPESSYLGALAYFGIFGGLILLSSVLLVGWQLLKVEHRKSLLGRDAILVNLVTANMGMIFASGISEAILLSALSQTVVFLYVNFALLAYLLDATSGHYDVTTDEHGQQAPNPGLAEPNYA